MQFLNSWICGGWCSGSGERVRDHQSLKVTGSCIENTPEDSPLPSHMQAPSDSRCEISQDTLSSPVVQDQSRQK